MVYVVVSRFSNPIFPCTPMLRIISSLVAVCLLVSSGLADELHPSPGTGVLLRSEGVTLADRIQDLESRGIILYDYHIHLRGGMTAEKAAKRQELTGIRSGVLENFGRDWPLSDNDKLRTFIEDARKAQANGQPLQIGLQVNDRDWSTRIDPKLFQEIDFILADTMIMMGVNPDGKPMKMWLDDYKIDNPEAWMYRYMDHNRQILGEPISILANPTYLPKPIEHLYDQLWTEERMREIILLAVRKNIAIEIQAGSKFPNLTFLKLAKELGAKFSFGTNNMDDQPILIERWFEMIDKLKLDKDDIWKNVKKLNPRTL